MKYIVFRKGDCTMMSDPMNKEDTSKALYYLKKRCPHDQFFAVLIKDYETRNSYQSYIAKVLPGEEWGFTFAVVRADHAWAAAQRLNEGEEETTYYAIYC